MRGGGCGLGCPGVEGEGVEEPVARAGGAVEGEVGLEGGVVCWGDPVEDHLLSFGLGLHGGGGVGWHSDFDSFARQHLFVADGQCYVYVRVCHSVSRFTGGVPLVYSW